MSLISQNWLTARPRLSEYSQASNRERKNEQSPFTWRYLKLQQWRYGDAQDHEVRHNVEKSVRDDRSVELNANTLNTGVPESGERHAL